MMDAAVGSASNYSESLSNVTNELGASKDREGLRAIVESLVATANEMQHDNHALENGSTRRRKRSPAAGEARGRPHREPDRSAHRARQPQALRRQPGPGDGRGGAAQRAALAGDDRHRPFQDLQRHLGPSDRRPGAAPRRHGNEAERQGPGHRRALRRRGVRGILPNTGCGRRSPWPTTSAARSCRGIDEALDRPESRPGHDLVRRCAPCARATPCSR